MLEPKKMGKNSKRLSPKKNFVQIIKVKKNFGPKKFWVKKNVGSINILETKILWHKIFR